MKGLGKLVIGSFAALGIFAAGALSGPYLRLPFNFLQNSRADRSLEDKLPGSTIGKNVISLPVDNYRKIDEGTFSGSYLGQEYVIVIKEENNKTSIEVRPVYRSYAKTE